MHYGKALPTILAVLAIGGIDSRAETAKPDPSLRVTLERAYSAWRSSMSAGDLDLWEKATAFSRQIETRNRIVSQRLPFPQALFDDPVEAPSVARLTPMGVLSTGTTATSTYYGKANFGPGEGSGVTDNLLVLHFLREETHWKFDNLRIVKLGNDGDVLLQIRNGDFSFLQGEEFQPASQLPAIPQPVEPPEYIAEAWIDSTGCETTITVNGHLTGKFKNIKTTELVMGGLRRGENRISIETKRLEEGANTSPKVEVAIYATKDPSEGADRVYHYRPDSVGQSVSETFVPE
ncbi:MAG: hypothetical protein WD342_14730 [Verrucomicrobiales bacterium]